MKHLLILLFGLLVQYAAAQPKINQIPEISEEEHTALISRYSGGSLDQGSSINLNARADSAVKKAFPEVPDPGFSISLEVLVSKDGVADHIFFELNTSQKSSQDSLASRLKAALKQTFRTFKADSDGRAAVHVIGFVIGKIKTDRKVRQLDSSVTDIAQAVGCIDTLAIKRILFNELELKEVPAVIYRFPNLEDLYLGKNKISYANFNLSLLPKLRQLHLEGNQLTNGSLKIKKNKSVRVLNLNENRFTNIPGAARKCRGMESLWLAGNKLTGVSNLSFRRLNQVVDLNFYRSAISVLPRGIRKMHNLKVLDLYYNDLNRLPNSITKLHRLEQLAISHNRISKLPEKMYRLNGLNTLYAHHNHLSILPEKISELQQIQILDLGYNWFNQFPGEISDLKNLRELDLSANNLSDFPASLLKMPGLEKLYLRANPFIGKDIEVKYNGQLSLLKEKNIEVFY